MHNVFDQNQCSLFNVSNVLRVYREVIGRRHKENVKYENEYLQNFYLSDYVMLGLTSYLTDMK